jgi:hypothetical protein
VAQWQPWSLYLLLTTYLLALRSVLSFSHLSRHKISGSVAASLYMTPSLTTFGFVSLRRSLFPFVWSVAALFSALRRFFPSVFFLA